MTARALVLAAIVCLLLVPAADGARAGVEAPSRAARLDAERQAQATVDGVRGPRWTLFAHEVARNARTSDVVFYRDAANAWRYQRVVRVSWGSRGYRSLRVGRSRRFCRLSARARPKRAAVRAGRLVRADGRCAFKLRARSS